MNKLELIETLKSNVVELIFTKEDGSSRTMQATLDASRIPEQVEESLIEQGSLLGFQTVWDVESNDWRRFVWNRLESPVLAD